MEGPGLITDLVILFGAAAVAAVIVGAIRGPVLVGFLLAGVVIGPYGLGLVSDPENVHHLAELGVVLLLFSIGLEFSLARMWSLGRTAIIGGGGQVLGSTVAGTAAAWALGLPLQASLVVGFVISLSSTALVLKALSERGEVDAPHGRVSVAILIVQDLAVVPMVLVIPALAGDEGAGVEIAITLAKAVGVVVVILVAARRIVPWILDRVADLRSREAFLMTMTVVFLGTAWLTTAVGLSMALGAFLAGLVISESEHRLVVLSEAIPFRDLFNALFFVSVGMLLNTQAVAAAPLVPIVLALVIFAGKAAITGVIVRSLGHPGRVAVLSATALGQVGEFSFVLLLVAAAAAVLPAEVHQLMVSTTVLTMLLTPFALAAARSLLRRHEARLLARDRDRLASRREEVQREGYEGHVVIIGFGLNGANLARVLKATGVPYAIADMNPQTVRAQRQRGEPIFRGDASRPEVLEQLGIERAQMVVVAINDPEATRRATRNVRLLAPDVHLLVRTRYVAELDELYALGADQVVPEEFETSIEIFSRVLHRYRIPNTIIRGQVEAVRGDRYRGLREEGRLPQVEALLTKLEVDIFTLEPSHTAVGCSLIELDLRRRTGANVVAVVRGDEPLEDAARVKLAPRDTLVLAGVSISVSLARSYLEGGAEALACAS